MIRAHLSLMAAVLGLAVVTPSVASAQQVQASAAPRQLRGLSVSLVVASGRRFGEGYRLFDREDGDGGAGGEVALDVASPGASGKLALGIGLQGESYKSAGGSLRAAKLETTALYGLAVLRWRSAATWQPYVALAAGLESAELTLDPTLSPSMKSEAMGLFGRASLGLRFAPRRLTVRAQNGDSVFALALGLEAAALAGTPLSFEYQAQPMSLGAGDGDRIPTGTVSLGSVSRVGVQGRGLISLVF